MCQKVVVFWHISATLKNIKNWHFWHFWHFCQNWSWFKAGFRQFWPFWPVLTLLDHYDHYWTTRTTTGPPLGHHWAYTGPQSTKLGKSEKNPGFWPKCLKNKGNEATDPYHGDPDPYHGDPPYPWHRVPTTTYTTPGLIIAVPRVAEHARTPSPGFFWIQPLGQNTTLSKTTNFVGPKTTCQNWPFSEIWP